MNKEFFKNKKIFITGYNGFKGTWLSKVLIDFGANLCGYALKPVENSLFSKIDLKSKMKCIEGDIRDFDRLEKVFNEFQPEMVLHLAAQPIVIKSYEEPKYTYETNVIGTVNILECIRKNNCVKSFLNITTDKVYENLEHKVSFDEDDKLNGYDPYSNSKSCSELVTSSYKKSFLEGKEIAVSTARAGNTIGGGDNAEYRIIPDCVRAAKENKKIIVRNPNSVRPYQHVLDVICAYLTILQAQYENINLAGCYNVGPNNKDIITTEQIVKIFCKYWGNDLNYEIINNNNLYESSFLQLNCKLLKNTFNWDSVWSIEKTIEKIVEFEKYNDSDLEKCMEKQIQEFFM